MLKVEAAQLIYQGQSVFEELSFEVQKHEFIAILGRSGVGKTSLLRMLAGLPQKFPEPNTQISAKIFWNDQAQFSNLVSYMAQQDGLLPWLSVIDNVLLPQRLQGHVAQIECAKNLLREVGLQEHLDKKPEMLSGGMRQRVALARTLMLDRPILLMDEPFSALDALTRMEMQKLLFRMLSVTPKLVIMVTHDPWEALRLADRILVLGGRPSKIRYTNVLAKSQDVRDITPELLPIYHDLLEALNE